MNKKPFNQHKLMPTPQEQAAYNNMKWFRRHIIIDHPGRNIYIQVMWDGSGELKLQEARDIFSGMYWQYIPLEMVDGCRDGIQSGYKVKPIMFAGSPVGEMHAAFQIVAMDDARHHISDPILNQAVAE